VAYEMRNKHNKSGRAGQAIKESAMKKTLIGLAVMVILGIGTVATGADPDLIEREDTSGVVHTTQGV